MANGYVKLDSVAARNVDSYNLNFINSTVDIHNGGVFNKGAISTDSDKGEVFTTGAVATTDPHQTYMAYSAGDIVLTDADGEQYKIGLNDPRKFINAKGMVFNGFKPQLGDRLTLTLDAIDGTKPNVMDSTVHVIAVDGTFKLAYADTVGTGLSYRLVKRNDVAMGMSGGISSNSRVEAYQFECVQLVASAPTTPLSASKGGK